jgi:hypothetical protein
MGRRVATIAQSVGESRAAKAPISAHPAFPAIVALWFAALLGLGSLVLPIALIEKLVTVTGIASLIPAAEPPLGFTARAGIALAASIAGALVGLALARKVAATSAPEPKARGFSLASGHQCRPISAHDELGEDGLDSADFAPSSLIHKRRSLAMAEDNNPSAFLQAAPLPGQATEGGVEQVLAEEAFAPNSIAVGEAIFEAELEPLELGDFADSADAAEEKASIGEADGALEALRLQIHTPDVPAAEASPMRDPMFEPAAFEPKQAPDDPLPFAAPSLRRTLAESFDEDEPANEPQDDEVEDMEAYQPFADEPASQLMAVELGDESDTDARGVEEPGLIQLAARLGASIEKRRAWLAQRQSAAPVAPPPVAVFGESDDFEAVEADEAARAIADFFGPADNGDAQVHSHGDPVAPKAETDPSYAMPPAAVPAPLRGVTLDLGEEDDEDAFAASLALPLDAALSEPESPDAEKDEQFDEEEPEDGDYSSLLAMKNPFARQQEFVRIEEPEEDDGSIEPAVTFPSPSPTAHAWTDEPHAHASAARPFDPPKKPVESVLRPAPAPAPRDPGDAERSLRDALATLQRMSGAA